MTDDVSVINDDTITDDTTVTDGKTVDTKDVVDTKVEDVEDDKTKLDGAPEKYEDFTFPEGIKVDEKLMGEFMPIAKDLNLTQENAQKLVDLQANSIKQFAEEQQTTWDSLKNEWAESAKSDSEFGGTNFKANVAIAKVALDKFGTQELKDILDTTGTGSHPEMLRFFYRIGKELSEDKLHVGTAPNTGQDPAKILFSDMN